MNRRRVSITATATIVLVAATLAPATGGEAKWTRPQTVTRCGDCLGFPQLTTAARGGSIVAWQDNEGRLIARRVERNGTLRRKLTLARRSVPFNDQWAWISTGRSGATVAVWQDVAGEENGDIRARRVTRRGKLGRIHRIGGRGPAGGGFEGGVALDAAGNATIAWSWDFSIGSSQDVAPPLTTARARRLTAKGQRGPTIPLRAGEGFNDHARVAVAPTGRATVAWRFCCGLNSIAATTIGRNGKPSAIRDLSGPAGGSEPEVAMDARGNAIVVWTAPAVMTRRIDAAGALGPVQTLGPGEWLDSDPRVAFDRAGNATVVWRYGDIIQLRRISRDGALGPLTNLSGPPGPHVPGAPQVGPPEVAVDSAGNATAAWLRGAPTPVGTNAAIQARSVARDGKLGPIGTLFSGQRLTRPKVVAGARGALTVAWSQIRPRYDGAKISIARPVERRRR